MTGHAHHFLQRLDRLALPHVELALSLYNDVPMLRFILDEERVPERVERAAICLGDPDRGPHVIVSRDGRFVTALAEGMKPFDAHVVSRASLDLMAQRVTALRDRLRRSDALSTGEGHMDIIFDKIMRAGARFSRQDFQALAGLHPWLRMAFFRGVFHCGKRCLDLRAKLPAMKHLTRNARDEVLKDAWNTWWALNHFTVLTGIDLGWDLHADLQEALGEDKRPTLTLNLPHTRMGIFAGMIRGAWLAGRLGRGNVDLYASFYKSSGAFPDVLNAGLGLRAIGLRHPTTRARVAAALAPGPEPAGLTGVARHLYRFKAMFASMFDEDPEKLAAMTLEYAREILPECDPSRPPPSALPEHREALALSAYSQGLYDALSDYEGLSLVTVSLGTYTLFEPESFFLPRADFDYVLPRWQPSLSEALFAPTRASTTAPQPVRAAAEPGRNEPCSCGSGRKYKRCCLGVARG